MWTGGQGLDLHVVVDGKTIKQWTDLCTWAEQCVRNREVARGKEEVANRSGSLE